VLCLSLPFVCCTLECIACGLFAMSTNSLQLEMATRSCARECLGHR
jgi:hypothetical protein